MTKLVKPAIEMLYIIVQACHQPNVSKVKLKEKIAIVTYLGCCRYRQVAEKVILHDLNTVAGFIATHFICWL